MKDKSLEHEVTRAVSIHGEFPSLIHGMAVLRRECEEAWNELWLKPMNRSAMHTELLHVEATAHRLRKMLEEQGLPEPGPFATSED